jgi:hypothetical protein
MEQAVTPMLDARRAEFEELYFGRRMAPRRVAQHFGISHTALVRWMRKRGIPIRTQAEAQRIRAERNGEIDGDVIFLRLKERRALSYIARVLGFRSRTSVFNILSDYGLSGPLESLPSHEAFLEQATKNEETRCPDQDPFRPGESCSPEKTG